jgi:predicted SAM-dependent methyltransferase
MKLLNLGCGSKYHPDWINVNFYKSGPDVIVHDLNNPFPWGDSSFDMIYHSHVLEHFTKEKAIGFLLECKRVLKPGGILRVVIPDLESIITEYSKQLTLARSGDQEASNRYNWIIYELFDQVQRNQSGGGMLEYWKQKPLPAKDFIIQRLGMEVKGFLDYLEIHPPVSMTPSSSQSPRSWKTRIQDRLLAWMGYTREMAEIGKFRLSGEVHYWMYDEFSLGQLLESVGFVKFKRVRADESGLQGFSSYNLDTEPDGSIRKPDSGFFEVRKENREA